jgi:hypothetical protein
VRAGSVATDAFLGETEVGEADVAPGVKQDVLRLEVPGGREGGREGGKEGRRVLYGVMGTTLPLRQKEGGREEGREGDTRRRSSLWRCSRAR